MLFILHHQHYTMSQTTYNTHILYVLLSILSCTILYIGIAKFFLSSFSDVQFYLGPSFDSSSMVFSIYQDGDTTPTFYYILGGFDIIKF